MVDYRRNRKGEMRPSYEESDTSVGDHLERLAKEKFDPRMKSVSSGSSDKPPEGGLGAYAKKNQAKPKTGAGDAANALAGRKRKGGGY